ncbi:NACHT domain-containing protein [Amycolatopsis oliviviridis]|uniref:NACHT domain-containing protein n=1 Tax=Amycolatopsis oliviviridis TaxID=1471590 RepID=UPI00174E22B1|nr:NACHT domain-containing protein [Amycolatopsis oliviviridis]
MDLAQHLVPYGLGALILAVVVIWALKQVLSEYFKKTGGKVYDRSASFFSRRARFRKRLIRRYGEAVSRDYAWHTLGFVTDRVIDINSVYVPLQYELGGDRQDIYEKLRNQPRSVIIGPAGAGKSLLLKNSMLMWARRVRAGTVERVPVLIELHRCNDSSESIFDLIVSELSRSRVDRSVRRETMQEMVVQALRDGKLTLLFDGLDEVGRSNQGRVFKALRDFGREFPDCQIIVTCRDVVYRGQPLGVQFSHVVRVAEFDDAAIIRFLGKWVGLAGSSAASEVYVGLRKNPTLLRLARSPLLLTMIAYLQTEVFPKTGRRLPTSRPAFYQEAITHLLGRDADLGRADSLTVYEVGEKLAVLQRVALVAMESGSELDDRLNITKKLLESTTRKLLPDLNLDHTHIRSLLDEIIDRSQLLVSVNKKRTEFIFRHLTLQEYLAATELADDPDGLLSRYRAEPLAWRETVKLWCGASNRDSTKVIVEIFRSAEMHHKILALECLADAKRVDSKLARGIIEYFLNLLGEPVLDRAAIVAAVGKVAADGRPRGNEVLRKLEAIVSAGGTARVDAMHALSFSGRSEAAEALAPRNAADEDRRSALRGMGELALPVLTERSAEGFLWAVDDLAIVGTPAAAVALAHLLWQEKAGAIRAAWRLAVLLSNPNVEEELKRSVMPDERAAAEPWFSRPFIEVRLNGPLSQIFSRVGYLLENSKYEDIPSDLDFIDPRLGIPLALRSLNRYYFLKTESEIKIRAVLGLPRASRATPQVGLSTVVKNYFAEASKRRHPDEKVEKLISLISSDAQLTELQHRLIGLLSWPVRSVVYGTVLTGAGQSEIRDEDWSTVMMPRRRTYMLWSMFSVTLAIVIGGVLLAGMVRSILTLSDSWPIGPTWLSWLLQLFLPLLIAGVLCIEKGVFDVTSGLMIAVSVLMALVLAGLGMVTLMEWLPWYAVSALLAFAVAAVGCGLVARRHDRINDNPFRKCLEADAVRLDDRTSVIAS